MFYADNFTSSDAEYVGFVDSDTLFHSFVDREDLFEDGKPVIHGRVTKLKNIGLDKNKRMWADATYRALGLLEPMVINIHGIIQQYVDISIYCTFPPF